MKCCRERIILGRYVETYCMLELGHKGPHEEAESLRPLREVRVRTEVSQSSENGNERKGMAEHGSKTGPASQDSRS
jgi:hypothetical protein